jgi:hypothetical protein
MQEIASDLLGEAPLYLNGARLDTVGVGDARNRFAKACQELISFAFPNLRMLKGSYDESTLSDTLLNANSLLFGPNQAPSEPEQEILTYVMRNQNNGERTSVEEIIRYFGRRPYGWYPMAVLTLVGRLFRMGKVELRTAELLDADSALAHLKNSRLHGGVRVRLQEQFDPTTVNALKTFHQDFFDQSNSGTEARSVGQAMSEALAAEARDLAVLLEQVGRYPFLEQLRPVADRIAKLAEKDYSYLLNHLADFQDDLLTAKDDVLSPIKAFMHGPQQAVYDDAINFLRQEEANFAEFPPEEVQPLRDLAASARPYRGNVLPVAKAAVTRLRGLLVNLLNAERSRALAVLDDQEARLRSIDEFELLDASAREQVLASTSAARSAIASARFVTGIRDRLQRYNTQEYPVQLTLAAKLAVPVQKPVGGTTAAAPTHASVSVSYVTVASLRPKCSLPYIATQADLDQWLTALRAVAQAELNIAS